MLTNSCDHDVACNPINTKHCVTFIQRRPEDVGRRCINVLQMVCVYWECCECEAPICVEIKRDKDSKSKINCNISPRVKIKTMDSKLKIN